MTALGLVPPPEDWVNIQMDEEVVAEMQRRGYVDWEAASDVYVLNQRGIDAWPRVLDIVRNT